MPLEEQPLVPASPLMDPEIQKCPYDYYRRVRSESPVLWDEAMRCFIITTHALIREASRNVEVFSSTGSLDFPREGEPSAEALAIRARTYQTRPLTVTLDPPEHTDYRRIMAGALTPEKQVAARTQIQGFVKRFLSALLATGGGDFAEEFSTPLPFAVICTLMGLPEDMWGRVRIWADSYTAPLSGRITRELELQCAELYVERQEYLAALVAARRLASSPPDDLITAVALARRANGEQMEMSDVLSMIEQFVVAGAETTKNTLSSGAFILAQRPDLVAELREQPDRVGVFVEEVLRVRAPAQAMMRLTTRDTRLGGVDIPAGSKIMLRYGAGNTDEQVFNRAEEVDLSRANARAHLAFGHGIHMCQGAALARIELEESFSALVNQVDKLKLSSAPDAVQYIPAHSFMGFLRLELEMTPRATASA